MFNRMNNRSGKTPISCIFDFEGNGIAFLTSTYTLALLYNGHAQGMSGFTHYKEQQSPYIAPPPPPPHPSAAFSVARSN